MTAPSPAPSAADTPPRLNHVDSWIFDLDNTLYPASCSLFPQIDLRMRRFIAEALHLSLDEAFALQKRYYREFGTTLRGLMLVHHLEPAEFLAYVHDIDCTVLEPDPRLERALRGLDGRKIIFTNGSERHAVNVLERLGLSRHFSAIFDIRAADYIPKPNAESYTRLALRHAIDARAAAMFEDLARNLAPAGAAGMTTVWVREAGHSPWTEDAGEDLSHIQYVTDDLAGWLAGVIQARCAPSP